MTLDRLYKLATDCQTPIIGLTYVANPARHLRTGEGPDWHLHVATCTDFDRLRSLPADKENRWLNGDHRRDAGGPTNRYYYTDGGYIVHICTGCPTETQETAA